MQQTAGKIAKFNKLQDKLLNATNLRINANTVYKMNPQQELTSMFNYAIYRNDEIQSKGLSYI
jgi:hypothetical protein